MRKTGGVRGQVSLIFLLLAVPLILLIFSMARISIAVRHRINLQNAADAAALTAAAWEAKGLNQIALANAGEAALGLLEKAVRAGREPQKIKNARMAMLAAEMREFENVKTDVAKRIPNHMIEAALENARTTLTGKKGNARILGIDGVWRYRFGENGHFDPNENRVLSMAWAEKKEGYAFASALASSKSSTESGFVMAPDFEAALCRVFFTEESYGYLRQEPGLGFIRESKDELNEKIRH